MSTSRKILGIILILLSFFIINKEIYAAPTTTTASSGNGTINCSTYTDMNSCEAISGKCRWISGSCQAQYVADEPCNDNNIRTVLKLAGFIVLIAKIIVPMIIVGYGVFDMYKSVVDKDEKSLAKQTQKLLKRIVTGLVVFFIPTLVNVIFKLSDKLNIIDTTEYQTCASCVLDPTDNSKCSTTDVFDSN